ncbi:hypothetical protein [Spirosoma litoris]
MTAVEKYLEPARTYIQKHFLINGKVPGVYNGYISSFGVDVRQSGVLPALVLYLNTGDGAEGNRSLVVEAIAYLLDPQGIGDLKAFVDETFRLKNKRRKEVMNAAVALKMALRTFPMDKEKMNQ